MADGDGGTSREHPCNHCNGSGVVWISDIPINMLPSGNFGKTGAEKKHKCSWCGGKGIIRKGDMMYKVTQEQWESINTNQCVIDPACCEVFFPKIGEYYQAVCLYNGIVDKICPNNIDSLCNTKLSERPINHYHEWDGKNAWKCPCG